jgi:hypothetical protein
MSDLAANEELTFLGDSVFVLGLPSLAAAVGQGTQFTADEFKAFVESQSIQVRYGAVGQTHSLGLIDRFFRTAKNTLSLRSARPWCLKDVERYEVENVTSPVVIVKAIGIKARNTVRIGKEEVKL